MKILETNHFQGAKDCPYTLNGQNLVELRRARLRPIALALKLPADGPKNEMLKLVIAKLNAVNAEKELSDIG